MSLIRLPSSSSPSPVQGVTCDSKTQRQLVDGPTAALPAPQASAAAAQGFSLGSARLASGRLTDELRAQSFRFRTL